MKAAAVITILLLAALLLLRADETRQVDLSKVDRSIAKEPVYQHEPHYALLVFGHKASHRSWLVMDGDETLYVDRNGNGDLTDPEDRIERDEEATKKMYLAEESSHSGFNVFEIGTVAGVKLRFDFWVRKRDFTPADEWSRNIMREREVNNWENGSLYRIAADGSGAQNPTLMAAKPADAQVTHLDGPLTFGLKWGERQKLQPWPLSTTFDVHIGTPMLPPRNCGHKLFAPLTVSELPTDLHPKAVFTYPAKSPGQQPIQQTVELDQRCCGDTFYAKMAVPREASEGVAKVALTYYVVTGRVVHPATFEVPIGDERTSLDSETSYVMFSDPEGTIGLNEAMVALRVAGFKVNKITRGEPESLQIQLDDRPALHITLNRTSEVRDVAKALGENGPLAEALNHCDARFEILRVPDTSNLHEKEMATIHSVLQRETKGMLYTPWDKRLTGPE